jgi:hypothetical protein
VASAIAFPAAPITGITEPRITVVITDVLMMAEGIADFMDRRLAIERLVRDNLTPVAYLEFTPQGVFRGLSYQFGPDHGCDLCAGSLKSTVKLVSGRLTGTLSGKDGERTVDVALDVPVMGDNHGDPLPADGGEPGKAYKEYSDALVVQDIGMLRKALTLRRIMEFDTAPNAAELEFQEGMPRDAQTQMAFLASHHPVRAWKITKGWTTPTKALLIFEGESVKGKVLGEVVLMKEKGVWLVDEEIVQLVEPNK